MNILEEESYRCIKAFSEFYEKNFIYDIACDGSFFYSLNENENIVKFTYEFMEQHFEKM